MEGYTYKRASLRSRDWHGSIKEDPKAANVICGEKEKWCGFVIVI